VEATALFGRDDELARLAESLAAGRPVAVIGEAGVGKTTLVRAAAERARLELREGGALETLAWAPLLALQRSVGEGLAGDATAIAIEVERRVGPSLLFIDDLQWTDDATRQTLVLLAGRIALVVAIRATDPGATEARQLIDALGAEVIELGGVDRVAAIEIVRRARPALDASAAEILATEGGGNPLLLEELATRGRPTSSLARALTSRLDALGPAGLDAFGLLAVAGHALPVAILGPGAEDLRTVGVAVAIEPEPLTGPELAPRHALLAEAMLSTLKPDRLCEYHERLAGIVTNPGERAHHLAGAGRREEARAAAQSAADQASTPAERAGLLELVARMTEGPESLESRIAAARILVASDASSSARAIELLEPVADGPADLRVEREALLGKAYFAVADLESSRAAYTRGRLLDTGRPTAAGTTLAAGEAAFIMNVDGDVETARRILGDAIASGRDGPTVVATLEKIRAFVDGIDTFDAVKSAYEVLLGDPSASGSAFGIGRNVVAIALICRGTAPTLAFLERVIGDFEGLGLPGRANDLRAEDVQVLLFAGRLEEALRLADTLLERPLNRRTRQWTLTKRAQILAALGQTDLATETLDAITATATSDYAGVGELFEARIEVESWAGRPADVLAAFATHRTVPTSSHSTDIMPLLDSQWARLETGSDPGEVVAHQPWAMLEAAPLESEGIRALYRGDPTTASRRFRAAADLWAPFHASRELICRLGQGEALRRADSAEAPGVLRDTLARAEARGYAPIAARARRSLRQAGVHVAPPAGETDTQRWARMTRREREALQLVGRGLTTPQIARRMGLGRGTVDQVLGSATRKLGAASRLQAAAMLAEGPAGSRRARRVATVRTEADAGEVVLAALRGASLVVEPGTDPALVERIQGDLRRLGRDDALALEAAAPVADLSPDGIGLLGLLVGGMSLGEAAASLHLSRRTADRRLAEAREALGVATTAEALLAYQQRRRRG